MKSTSVCTCRKGCVALRLQSLALSAAALILLCLTMFPGARAETVIARKRVGNNSEGVTYVTSGHWKNRVVAIDGNDVLAINVGGPGDDSGDSLESAGHDPSDGALRGPGWKKIIHILALNVDARVPRGIVFLPGRNEFVFGPASTTNLFRTDEFGNPLAPIVLTGLANPTGLLAVRRSHLDSR